MERRKAPKCQAPLLPPPPPPGPGVSLLWSSLDSLQGREEPCGVFDFKPCRNPRFPPSGSDGDYWQVPGRGVRKALAQQSHPSPAPGPSWGSQMRGEEINFRNKTVVRIRCNWFPSVKLLTGRPLSPPRSCPDQLLFTF